MITAGLIKPSIEFKQTRVGTNLVGDVIERRSWRNLIRKKGRAGIAHQAKLNGKAGDARGPAGDIVLAWRRLVERSHVRTSRSIECCE